jgi:predicted ATPase
LAIAELHGDQKSASRPSSETEAPIAPHDTGREEELEILLRRWSKAKAGEGQVVLLSGEAGVGKSRLMVALLEAVASEPHKRLRNFCSPQHSDSALHPTIGQIECAAGFARDDAPKAKLDKLDALLAQSSTLAQDAALVGEMLSLPNDGRYPALKLTPQERRQKLLESARFTSRDPIAPKSATYDF